MMTNAEVLIVEDERIVAESIKRYLQDSGYHVHSIVSSGEEAIEKAKVYKLDLVLMDIVLSGEMDGIDAAIQIYSSCHVPVIFLTAYSDEGILKRAKKAEPFGYIVKPFRNIELRSAIEMALYKYEMERKYIESKERYVLAVSAGRVGVWDLNLKNNQVHVDPILKDMLGYKNSEISDHPDDWKRLIHRDDVEHTIYELRAYLNGSEPCFEVKHRLRHKKGNFLYFLCRGTAIRDKEGTPYRLMGTELDITENERINEALRKAHDQMEHRVIKRTAELEGQTKRLKETNTAMKVLLKQREKDKEELEENTLFNLNRQVIPYVEKLKKSQLDANQMAYIHHIESNIKNITSPLIKDLSSKCSGLTPTEIRIALLVKEGKTTKEIADILCLSGNTILFHRYNIRAKLGLKNKRINLRTYLETLN